MLRNLLFFGLLLSTQYLYAVDDRFAVTSGALSKKTDTNKAVQYYYGEDVQQDFAMAKKLFEKSVWQYNDKESLYYLGNIFFEGKGTKKDVKQGISYYLQSAQKGYSIAQYRLAGIYLDGNWLLKSTKMALHWFLKAAKQGHAESQLAVAMMHLDEANIAKNYPYNPAIPRYLYKLLPNFRDSMHQAAYWLKKAHNNSIVSVSKKSMQVWNDNELWLYE